MDIEPKALRTVIAAAEYGSFRRAAAALRMKQSTLSRRVCRLEEQLGIKLFERSSGGVHTTPTGGDIVRRAKSVLEQMDRMIFTARAAGRGEAGDIRIGICTSLSASKLRAAVASYINASPDVQIRLIESSRLQLLEGLRTGDIDIGIVVGETRDYLGPSMLLWSERIIVALPAEHHLTNKDMIFWTDLKGESFLLSRRDPGSDLHDIVVQKLWAPGAAPDIAIWDVSSESILAMLEAGQTISVHCESCAGLTFSGVVYREVRDASGSSYIPFTACWQSDNNNPALARFLELLRTHHPPASIT